MLQSPVKFMTKAKALQARPLLRYEVKKSSLEI